MPTISICLYSERVNNWEKFTASAHRACKRVRGGECDVIFTGPFAGAAVPKGASFIRTSLPPVEALSNAIRKSTGDFIAWGTDDAVYKPDVFKAAIQALDSHKLNAVYGFRHFSDTAHSTEFKHERLKRDNFFAFPFGVIPRSLYDKLGGFDARFGGVCAELDLCMRAQAQGAKGVLSKTVDVYIYPDRQITMGVKKYVSADMMLFARIWDTKREDAFIPAEKPAEPKPEDKPVTEVKYDPVLVPLPENPAPEVKDVKGRESLVFPLEKQPLLEITYRNKKPERNMAQQKSPRTVAVIHARGSGTSMFRKNVYPLLGVPLIEHFLLEMKRAECLDEICVWTEDAEISEITKRCGCIPLQRPRAMLHYQSGFSTRDEWDRNIEIQIVEKLGKLPDLHVSLNCNYVLFSAQSLDVMFNELLKKEGAHIIYPVCRAEPHLYMVNPNTNWLFPVWDHSGLDRQLFPQLFRRIGISIFYPARWKYKGPMNEAFHVVPVSEGWDVQCEEDVEYAEFALQKRQMKSVGRR